ncbi:MAG: porin family protein [Rhodobacteraceae bacterium]|nr:porin family protein [Paracoccaceae bacterium]
MKKHLLLASALTIALSVSANAGGFDAFAPDAVMTVPAEPAGTDWSGFYGGANVGFASGNIANGNASDDLADNTLFGVFAGYNMQRGNMVFGGEIDYAITPVEFANFSVTLDEIVDAKARVGYAFGNALVYGVLGYSFANLNELADHASLSGVSFGAGVDYKIGSRYFVGAEYLARSFSGDFVVTPGPGTAFSNQIVSTVKLRAGISF